MTENRPFEDYAGRLRCPHCAALATLVFTQTTKYICRVRQTENGQWQKEPADPTAQEGQDIPQYFCETCEMSLGQPEAELLRAIYLQRIRPSSPPDAGKCSIEL